MLPINSVIQGDCLEKMKEIDDHIRGQNIKTTIHENDLIDIIHKLSSLSLLFLINSIGLLQYIYFIGAWKKIQPLRD